MSNHLPECDLSYDCGLPHVQGYCHQCEMYCVCDRLNACTARVRAACIAAVEAHRDRYAALAADSDEDSLVGRRYRDYLAAHIADINTLREVQP